MSSVSLFFHAVCTTFGLEKEAIDVYSMSLTRGFFSTWITQSAYDLLSDSTPISTKYQEYFLLYTSYLIYDSTMTLFQYVQSKSSASLEELLFHGILLSFTTIMDSYQLHSLVLYMGLSHGMYILSGFELCFEKFHSSTGLSLCNMYSFIYHLYRTLYIFPSMIMYFHTHTHGNWFLFSLFLSYMMYRYEIRMIKDRKVKILSFSYKDINTLHE
jgi:hypothetical protein